MTWNRGGQRVTNMLGSLLEYQVVKPREVVLVDTSDDKTIAVDVERRAGEFSGCKLVRRPRNHLYKSWALNIGIQNTSPESDWVATTDIDFMFGRKTTRILESTVTPKALLIGQALRLPRGAEIPRTLDRQSYYALCMSATWWGRTGGPGTIQCAMRDWWFKVRGYDERFAEGLGGMDDDVIIRARNDGLHVKRLTFEQLRPLHQWHEPTNLKNRLQHLKDQRASVVANPGGWGEL
jgi:glycosyltransferase involved in cell wall biosynthesis